MLNEPDRRELEVADSGGRRRRARGKRRDPNRMFGHGADAGGGAPEIIGSTKYYYIHRTIAASRLFFLCYSRMAPYERLPTEDNFPPAYDNEPSSSKAVVYSSKKGGPTYPGAIRSHVAPNDALGIVGIFLGGTGLVGSSRRNAYDVYHSVRGILSDLVLKQHIIDADSSGAGILHSCNEVCAAHRISFPSILHSNLIARHTALYWAILRRPHSQRLALPDVEAQKRCETRAVGGLPPLVRDILSYAEPFTDAAMEDAAVACLHAGERWMLECLRAWDYDIRGRRTLDPDSLPDLLHFHSDDAGGYYVGFDIPNFYKRMQLREMKEMQFIAYGRLWSIQFQPSDLYGSDLGTWAFELILQEGAAMRAKVTLTVPGHNPGERPLTALAEPEWHKTHEQYIRAGEKHVETKITLFEALTDPESIYFGDEGELTGSLWIQPLEADEQAVPTPASRAETLLQERVEKIERRRSIG
ncbi:hypothetical protein MKEN_01334500 [Mycena kentingensis (nom. inval.)]|nr:hypothetical protein MKEN_01334500 [Mycena kentingensis (nom. inval.)]